MQPTPGGSRSSSTGGAGGASGSDGEVNRGGIARFCSAPATWLEALLEEEEEEEEEEDPLKPHQCLTQLLTATPTTANSVSFLNSADPAGLLEPTGFLRQNSSPADFLGNNSAAASDASFSDFGVPANYDYLSKTVDVFPSSKRAREPDTQYPPAKFHSQLKGDQSGETSSGVSNLKDVDMEKLLEDSVPFRVRAKRGCATHPRSIAERVRRTRISDRIRKLQELVPNMDKQTNTADMLEEAVEYVKYLQRQIQELTEHQRKCKCKTRE